MEDLKSGEVKFELVKEFLMELKKKFRGEYEKSVKVAKLKKIEQEERTMKEFVQKFKNIAKGSRYKGRALVEKFKREMNKVIRNKLMEAEMSPTSIEQ